MASRPAFNASFPVRALLVLLVIVGFLGAPIQLTAGSPLGDTTESGDSSLFLQSDEDDEDEDGEQEEDEEQEEIEEAQENEENEGELEIDSADRGDEGNGGPPENAGPPDDVGPNDGETGPNAGDSNLQVDDSGTTDTDTATEPDSTETDTQPSDDTVEPTEESETDTQPSDDTDDSTTTAETDSDSDSTTSVSDTAEPSGDTTTAADGPSERANGSDGIGSALTNTIPDVPIGGSLTLIGSIVGLAGLLETGLVLLNRRAKQTAMTVGTDSPRLRIEPGERCLEQYPSVTIRETDGQAAGAATTGLELSPEGERPFATDRTQSVDALTAVFDHAAGGRDPTHDEQVIFDDVFSVATEGVSAASVTVRATGSTHVRFIADGTDLRTAPVTLAARDRLPVSVVFDRAYRTDDDIDVVVTVVE